MELKEFRKQQRDNPYEGDHWIRDERVATRLGEFTVEFWSYGERDRPDREMLRRGAELVRFMEEQDGCLLDLVFAAYQRAERFGLLERSDVPEGLTRDGIGSCLRDEYRNLIVTRDSSRDPTRYVSAIVMVTGWDNSLGDGRYALALELGDGRIVSVNEEAFTLVDGVLRYEWEEVK